MRMTRRTATTSVLRGFSALTALLSTPLAAQAREPRCTQGDGAAPAFIANATIEILSMDAFVTAGKQHFPTLLADLPNFSNIARLGQIEEIMEILPLSWQRGRRGEVHALRQ
jgi:hypothetical protein